MAINEAVNINVDVKGTQQINEAGKAAENLDRTSKQMRQGLNDAAKSTTLMGNATGKLRDKLNKTNKNFKDLQGQLAAIPGPVGFVIQGFTGVSTAMKTMLANPVGIFLTAIVGVLYTLKRALTDSERGQDRLNRVLTVAGALWGNILDLIADVGEAIIKAVTDPIAAMKSFANGVKNFIKNPIDSIKNAYNGATESAKAFVKEQKEEIKAADEVAKMRNRANKIERALLIERSELEQQIAELRLKSRQEDEFSAEVRKQALLDAQVLEDQLLDKEVKALELRRDAQILENTFSRTNRENADKEAQAIAAVNNVVSRRLNLQRATQRELNRVNNELAILNKAEEKRQALLRKAEEKRLKETEQARIRIQEQREKEEKQQQEGLINRFAAEREATDEHFAKSAQMINTFNAANQRRRENDVKQTEETEKAKRLAQQQTVDTLSQILQQANAIVGENTAAAKAFAIADAVVNTYKAANVALSSAPPPFNFALVATTIASGLFNVQKILETKPNDTGSTTSGAARTPSVPQFRPPTQTLPGTEDFTGQNRVYVTEADISNTQNKVKVTEGISTVK